METASPSEQKTKACPICGEEILAVAKKCKHCGEFLTAVSKDKPEGSKKSALAWICLPLLVVAVLAYTNPPKADHKNAVFDKLRSMVSGKGGFIDLSLRMAQGIAHESNQAGFDFGTYHNYLVFSTLTRGEEVWSYGILGKVFVRIE